MEDKEPSAASVSRSGSFRKRPLEQSNSDAGDPLPTKHERAPSETDMDYSSFQPSTGTNAVLDEIEEHFQRSLANVRQKQDPQQQVPHSSTRPLVILHPPHPSEEQNHSSQSSQAQTTPTSSTTSSSQQTPHFRSILPKSSSSSDTPHNIIVTENACTSSPTSVLNKAHPNQSSVNLSSPSTSVLNFSITSLTNSHTPTQQHQHQQQQQQQQQQLKDSTKPVLHPTVIPVLPASVTGQTTLANPPLNFTNTPLTNSSVPMVTFPAVTPIQTVSPLTLAASQDGTTSTFVSGTPTSTQFQNLIPLSQHLLNQQVSLQQQQQQQQSQKHLLQNVSASLSNSAQRKIVAGSPITASSLTTLSSLQTTPPPSHVIAVTATTGGLPTVATTAGLASIGQLSGGGLQIQVPSVTQPGSVQIIDLTKKYTVSAGCDTSIGSDNTVTHNGSAATIVSVPNMIGAASSMGGNPAGAGGVSSPGLKNIPSGVMTSSVQSPLRATVAPPITPTLLTQQTAVGGGASPSLMPVIDPQLLTGTAGAAGTNPIVLLPTPSNIMQPQPYILINPTDISSLQQLQLQQANASNLLAASGLVNPAAAAAAGIAGTSIVPNPAGGYLLLSPGAGTSFSMPFVNVAPSTSTVAHPGYVASSSPVATTGASSLPGHSVVGNVVKPNSLGATPHSNTSPKKTVNPLSAGIKRNSSTDISPTLAASSEQKDVMNMTPASVEDHFAKALGEQWSQLKNYSNHPQTVATAQNTVAS